eukprot:CAMPEP_0195121594 /NCGR_PEP_ID=MMETSP0448-20130528/124563_1 /TAXON_ID=66468 /ORGANISM="Heterocapsa triquestra, Strain CCMP 448" /LENGTH=109 /DNA_ID=CAMNT_0040159065 /DNA_START=302 /DNA_END=631 /DNA_ORIENTATION=-
MNPRGLTPLPPWAGCARAFKARQLVNGPRLRCWRSGLRKRRSLSAVVAELRHRLHLLNGPEVRRVQLARQLWHGLPPLNDPQGTRVAQGRAAGRWSASKQPARVWSQWW